LDFFKALNVIPRKKWLRKVYTVVAAVSPADGLTDLIDTANHLKFNYIFMHADLIILPFYVSDIGSNNLYS